MFRGKVNRVSQPSSVGTTCLHLQDAWPASLVGSLPSLLIKRDAFGMSGNNFHGTPSGCKENIESRVAEEPPELHEDPRVGHGTSRNVRCPL